MDSLDQIFTKKWHRPFPSTVLIGTPFGVKGSQWKRWFHEGDDFLVPFGNNVEVADTGHVGFAGDGGDGFGIYVRVEHSDGTKSYYTHLSKSFVAIGDVVMRGQVIALSGNSGNVHHDGHPVTPQEREEGKGSHCHVQARDLDGNSFRMIYEEKASTEGEII